MYVNLVKFSFNESADVALVHIMLKEGYDVYTVGHPTVVVELKVARRDILTQPSVYVFFILKLIENIRKSYLLIPLFQLLESEFQDLFCY